MRIEFHCNTLFSIVGLFGEARDAVHAAGGILFLAHVADQVRNDTSAQTDLVRAIVEAGADGFEVYHPKNILYGDVGTPAKTALPPCETG